MSIQNDQDLKKALSALSVADQRVVGARFVESVIHLNSDPLIVRALKIAEDKMHSQVEFDEVYKSVKSLAVSTYTACGDDADWPAQAAHFVATATKACLTPVEQLGTKNNLAWKCAMQARMAKNCEMIDSDEIDNEAQKQYAIVEELE